MHSSVYSCAYWAVLRIQQGRATNRHYCEHLLLTSGSLTGFGGVYCLEVKQFCFFASKRFISIYVCGFCLNCKFYTLDVNNITKKQ